MWPFKSKVEKRSGYTSSILDSFQASAESGISDTAPLATAALEACSGLYARSMAAAVVRNAPEVESALTPPVLALIARNMIRRGESFERIFVRRGRVVLEPIGFAYLHGFSPDPMSWMYNTTSFGPTDSKHEIIPAASVVHCRYAVDSARPWLGVAPWAWAGTSSKAVAALDKLVADEASAPHGNLLGVPDQPEDLTDFRNDMKVAKGRTLIMQYSGDWQDNVGMSGRSGSKLEHLRYGMDRTQVDPLRTAVGRDVLAACGVPPTLLVASSDGTGQREAYRRFLHSSLRPLARIIEAELRVKLDAPELILDLSELHASDTAGRARSFKAFMDAGMSGDDAARECGVRLTTPIQPRKKSPPPSNNPPQD